MAIAHPDELSQAQEAYSQAETSERDYETVKTNSARSRNMDRIETLERAALANIAMCAIATQQKALAIASSNLTAAYRLFARASDLACKIAPQSSEAKTEAVVEEDPFLVKPGDKGANERSKDVSVSAEKHSSSYDKKHLSGLHWAVAEVSSSLGMKWCKLILELYRCVPTSRWFESRSRVCGRGRILP